MVNDKLNNSQAVTQMLTNERASTSGVSTDYYLTGSGMTSIGNNN